MLVLVAPALSVVVTTAPLDTLPGSVVVMVAPALSVVVTTMPPPITPPEPSVAVLLLVMVWREVTPEEIMVMTVALWFEAPVAVLRTEAPVAVAVMTDPLASVVVRRTTTPVAAELDVSLLPSVVVTVATTPPAPSVVVNGPPVESVPVLTTRVLVPADWVAVTVATLVEADARAAKVKLSSYPITSRDAQLRVPWQIWFPKLMTVVLSLCGQD